MHAEKNPDRICRQGNFAAGFTLIEVLVAMAIVGIGMIAVFSSMSQSMDVTSRLRDKTLATWIAMDQITQLQVTGEYPDPGDRRDVVMMADTEWRYTMKIIAVPNMSIRRLEVDVSRAESPEYVVANAVGFVRETVQQAAAPPGAGQQPSFGNNFGEGWRPLDPNQIGDSAEQ